MITLVTGGSGSGKSAYAEDEIIKLGDRERIYIATMKPWDEECRRRIQRHRLMRAEKQFETAECYCHLERLMLKTGIKKRAILLECVSNLVSNELFGTEEEEFPTGISEIDGKHVADSVIAEILHLNSPADDLVIVTNEVFSDGDHRGRELTDWDNSTALYLQVLGEVNCGLGAAADRVIEVTAGIPLVIKG